VCLNFIVIKLVTEKCFQLPHIKMKNDMSHVALLTNSTFDVIKLLLFFVNFKCFSHFPDKGTSKVSKSL